MSSYVRAKRFNTRRPSQANQTMGKMWGQTSVGLSSVGQENYGMQRGGDDRASESLWDRGTEGQRDRGTVDFGALTQRSGNGHVALHHAPV
ncbi:unnamed protein product [Pleuronectes platessa]|uniref:Uncharacterized protein n=1 Tax=Pleuronectes platessa TaxID=8262 RepID=A0A9N7YYM0_PLEPL|nr:unnamed protein product [Pleuronectes platessa]